MELKYGGFVYIFDIGGSYESVVELYGGRVDKVGKDGPRVNPFALDPTEDNLKFLYSFVKLLLTNGGAELSPEDEDVVFSAVRGMYQLDAVNRRLSNLLLPKHLNRYLSKWTGNGVYAAVFDNVHDELELGRVQWLRLPGREHTSVCGPDRASDGLVAPPDQLGPLRPGQSRSSEAHCHRRVVLFDEEQAAP